VASSVINHVGADMPLPQSLDPAGEIESDEEPISKKNSKAKRIRSEQSSPEKPKGRKILKESE
jgi:hypothetical protein